MKYALSCDNATALDEMAYQIHPMPDTSHVFKHSPVEQLPHFAQYAVAGAKRYLQDFERMECVLFAHDPQPAGILGMFGSVKSSPFELEPDGKEDEQNRRDMETLLIARKEYLVIHQMHLLLGIGDKKPRIELVYEFVNQDWANIPVLLRKCIIDELLPTL